MKRSKTVFGFLSVVFISSLCNAQNFWQPTNGPNNWVTGLSLTESNNIIANTFPWGNLFYSTDSGVFWKDLNVQGRVIETINDSIFVRGDDLVYVSNDTGKTWDSTGALYAFSLYYEPTTQVIYLGTNAAFSNSCDIYTSTDFGQNWEWLYTFPRFYCGQFITALYVTKKNQVILVGEVVNNQISSRYTFYISRDHGQTFSVINQEYTNCVYRIIEDESSNLYALLEFKLMVSTDEGQNWTTRSISSSEALDSDYSGRIFRTGDVGGVKYSSDMGINWIEMDMSGLNSGIKDIIIDKNNRIFLATYEGVYKGEADSIVVSAGEITHVNDSWLHQNYPNPFNPSTKIKYSVPKSSQVQIKVFDVLGNEIETLVNEEKPAGTYELTWYAEVLPCGVYFYQLRAGEFVQTRKMILIK